MSNKQLGLSFGLNAKQLIAFVICAGLLLITTSFPIRGIQGPLPRLKSESQLRSEAALYDTAVREISSFANLKLTAVDDVKPVEAILDKQIPNLRFARSKLLAIGLSDSTFISAVKARASDKPSADQFALELAKDGQAILKLSGAQSLADRMRNSLQSDVTKLRSVAERLKRAAAEIKSKAQSNHAIASTFKRSNSKLNVAGAGEHPGNYSFIDGPDVGAITLLVVAVAVVICPPLFVAVVDLSANAVIAGAIYQAAKAYINFLRKSLGADTGPDELAICEDRANEKYGRCIEDAHALPYPLSAAAETACYSVWLFDAGLCLFTS